jgi:hypothetical protein
MPNSLRTDYILYPAETYDPMRAKRNALGIQTAEADIGRKQAVTEGIQKENVLRQQQIERQPFINEVEAVEYMYRTWPMVEFDEYEGYKAHLQDRGLAIPMPSFRTKAEFDDYKRKGDAEMPKVAAPSRSAKGPLLPQRKNARKPSSKPSKNALKKNTSSNRIS